MPRRPTRRLVAAGAALLAAGGAALGLVLGSPGGPRRWVIHDLGTLPGFADCTAEAISERGWVVGSCGAGPGPSHAFLWRKGSLTDLGRVDEYPPLAINARGEVVGGGTDGPFLWRDGRRIRLARAGAAVDVDDRGQVVGTFSVSRTSSHAFLWEHGRLRDLGTLGGATSSARAVNERGQVIGTSQTPDGRSHGFLWQDGRMLDLGVLRSHGTMHFTDPARQTVWPVAIDDRGTVVGYVSDELGGREDAFVWRNGRMSDFGTANGASEALAVNGHGQILFQTRFSDKRGDAYLWQDGRLRGLPTFDDDTPATFARVLNDRGEIAGDGLVEIGNQLSFVWSGGPLTPLRSLTGQLTAPWQGVIAINDAGEVIGSNYVVAHGRTELHPVLWKPQGG